MKYHKYEVGPYNIHTIKTDKFKKITIKVNFKRLVKKDEITIRNFLSDVMVRSTKTYKTERLMNMATEDLYDLSYRSFSTISGNYSIISFDITFLSPKYSEENILKEAIDFLKDIIFNPNVENNRFNSDNFNLTKKTQLDVINSLEENPSIYSRTRMLEELDKKLPISYRVDGYAEDVNKITEESLYEYYKSVINNDIVDIFVIGDIDSTEFKNLITENFKIKTIKHQSMSHYIEHTKNRAKIKKVVEQKNFKQSRLLIGCKAFNLTDFERHYVSVIYSFILGGSPDSKLFKNVREKNSLCYSISSGFYLISNLLVIGAGINKNNFKKTVNLIKKEIKNMENGKFEDDMIKKAQATYITSCKELVDSPMSIINNYVSMEYLNIDTLDKRMENIKKVTKEMIINFAKKINIDTIYLLEGDNVDEED